MFASRNLVAKYCLRLGQQHAQFHATARAFVQVGDTIPDLEVLAEGSPGNKVNLGQALKTGKGLVIGVPAAFSPSCSEKHVPAFLSHPGLKDAGNVFVVAVNDAFVTKAWAKHIDPSGESKVRFLADPSAQFSKALDLTFDGSAIFGGPRSKRYALRVKDGKVEEVFVEPDNTGVNATTAQKVLG